MTVYNKLVRDRIPEVIEASGKKCEVRVLDDQEYILRLNQKLQEELQEYLADQSVEELADMVELIQAILEFKEVSLDQFEQIRKEKHEVRGGFRKRLFLVNVSE